MLEEEAKTKWCPMAKHTMDHEGSFHTTNGQKTSGLQCCIGSLCMIWESWEWKNIDNEIRLKGQGDCGLKTKELQCNV